ncbi:PD-(D/E)XK nuclease family protein [Candidatus Woesearchaeota archaeon]|nr:PD-(D/E)XK nuclease family protein [Candidatus Woesearchaeota archaeon]
MAQLSEWRNSFKGIRWKDSEGNLVRGAIDDLLVHEGKLTIIDYKTRGFPIKEDAASRYQHQMDIYNFLFRKNGFATEDYALLVFYYPKEMTAQGVVFTTEFVRLETSVTNAESFLSSALETLHEPIPPPSEDCTFCSWKANNF